MIVVLEDLDGHILRWQDVEPGQHSFRMPIMRPIAWRESAALDLDATLMVREFMPTDRVMARLTPHGVAAYPVWQERRTR